MNFPKYTTVDDMDSSVILQVKSAKDSTQFLYSIM